MSLSFPVALDSGGYLGFRRAPSTDSWKFADDSYVLRAISIKLCSDIYGDDTPDYSDDNYGTAVDNIAIFDIEDYGVLSYCLLLVCLPYNILYHIETQNIKKRPQHSTETQTERSRRENTHREDTNTDTES
jgi:hypothetical protein